MYNFIVQKSKQKKKEHGAKYKLYYLNGVTQQTCCTSCLPCSKYHFQVKLLIKRLSGVFLGGWLFFFLFFLFWFFIKFRSINLANAFRGTAFSDSL